MKIVICGSIDFTPEIKKISDLLSANGFDVDIPLTSQRIIRGEITLREFKQEKKTKDGSSSRKIKDDVIRRYFQTINDSNAVLILNYKKKGLKNYIGGNTFLEMGFAHVLNKRIYLLNPIPNISYKDEIEAMQPVIINGDLSKIK